MKNFLHTEQEIIKQAECGDLTKFKVWRIGLACILVDVTSNKRAFENLCDFVAPHYCNKQSPGRASNEAISFLKIHIRIRHTPRPKKHK
jgi:hypothetical protein